MYFGLYQIPRRHDQFDAHLYETPCAGPDPIDLLAAFLRRLVRALFH
jgi:hypothetical protein